MTNRKTLEGSCQKRVNARVRRESEHGRAESAMVEEHGMTN